MISMKKIFITGAAGNLGGLLADYLKDEKLILNLLVHKKNVAAELGNRDNVRVFRGDLAKPETLREPLEGVDVVVHFAGVLFKHNPEKFLPKTNTEYFKNLLKKSADAGVKRIILISFPHVEGESTPEKPAKGKLDGAPTSAHARTRLEEEKALFALRDKRGFEAVSLRLGMVYGNGILMIDAARWFAKRRILGVWRRPTWIHLISKDDYLETTKQAILKENVNGIYHVGDDGVQTLQQFLDDATKAWGYPPPKRMPLGLIMFVARIFEFFSFAFGTKSPLTRDFIKIGSVSYYGDTTRMREELLPELKYKTYMEGMETL